MSIEDAEKYAECFNDFKVSDGVDKSRKLITAQGEREWLENSVKKDDNYMFAIVNLENDELIGNCGLNHIDFIRRMATLELFIGDEKKEIGRRRKAYFVNGKYYDEIVMDILAEEFKGDCIKNKNV